MHLNPPINMSDQCLKSLKDALVQKVRESQVFFEMVKTEEELGHSSQMERFAEEQRRYNTQRIGRILAVFENTTGTNSGDGLEIDSDFLENSSQQETVRKVSTSEEIAIFKGLRKYGKSHSACNVIQKELLAIGVVAAPAPGGMGMYLDTGTTPTAGRQFLADASRSSKPGDFRARAHPL